ncbi:MAG: hypothetical protein KAS59_05445 [Alphaproteobacteria bacterium]|nr:hypothetical protein [Alphaproteobacteria bacterium]
MSENPSQNQSKDMHSQMHDSLAFIIGLIVSFFISPFIISIIKGFFVSFSVAVTGGILDNFTAGLICSAGTYLGIFFATTYFVHIKLTVMGTRMITKQFESEAAHKNPKDKSESVAFIKGVIFILSMLLAIVLLSGCNEEQNQHQSKMQAEANAAALCIVQENNRHEQKIAEERGRFAKEEADAQRNQEMALETMAINAARKAQQAFYDLINGTISPLIMWITGIVSFCGLVGFGIFRFCVMRERIAECHKKEAVAVAFVMTMTPEERQKAFKSFFAPNVLDLKAIQ